MDVVEEAVDHRLVRLGFVVAGLLAARRADAGHRSAHGRAGAAEVEAHFVDLVPGLLHVFGGAALHHDVARLAVQRDQAGTVLVPDVAELAQRRGVVVHAGGRHDTQGVEFGGILEHRLACFVLDLGEARDDAAAVAADTDGAALPVTLAGLVGVLEVAEDVDHVVFILGQALEAGDETGPGSGFQLIQVRGGVHGLGHGRSLLVVGGYCDSGIIGLCAVHKPYSRQVILPTRKGYMLPLPCGNGCPSRRMP